MWNLTWKLQSPRYLFNANSSLLDSRFEPRSILIKEINPFYNIFVSKHSYIAHGASWHELRILGISRLAPVFHGTIYVYRFIVLFVFTQSLLYLNKSMYSFLQKNQCPKQTKNLKNEQHYSCCLLFSHKSIKNIECLQRPQRWHWL